MDPEYFPVQEIKKQLASLDDASAGGSEHQAITQLLTMVKEGERIGLDHFVLEVSRSNSPYTFINHIEKT